MNADPVQEAPGASAVAAVAFEAHVVAARAGVGQRPDRVARKRVGELDSREVFAMAPPSPLAPEISRWLQTLKTTAPAAR